MSLMNDHGPGQSAPGDGPWQSYAPAPRVTIHATSEFVGRHAYQMTNAAKNAAIGAKQLENFAGDYFGQRGFEHSREEILAQIEACQKSLANAMAILIQSEAT